MAYSCKPDHTCVVEDVKSKAAEIASLAGEVGAGAGQRDKTLQATLRDAQQFTELSQDVMSSLRDLKDSLLSQQLPGVDTEAIREQQSELAVSFVFSGELEVRKT